MLSFNPLVTVTAVKAFSPSFGVNVIVGAVAVPPNANVPSTSSPPASVTIIVSPSFAVS